MRVLDYHINLIFYGSRVKSISKQGMRQMIRQKNTSLQILLRDQFKNLGI